MQKEIIRGYILEITFSLQFIYNLKTMIPQT